MIIIFDVLVIAIFAAAFVALLATTQAFALVAGIFAIIIVAIYIIVWLVVSIQSIAASPAYIPICIVNAIKSYPVGLVLYCMVLALGEMCAEFNLLAILGAVIGIPIILIVMCAIEIGALQGFLISDEHPILGCLLTTAVTIVCWAIFMWFYTTHVK